mmetsp:Transcript_45537/g.89703  ORF Transcript_45537/g.89703 Transcript_45537/m.89703 type:complete len:99 (+) Transcript_45537:143-439(+)
MILEGRVQGGAWGPKLLMRKRKAFQKRRSALGRLCPAEMQTHLQLKAFNNSLVGTVKVKKKKKKKKLTLHGGGWRARGALCWTIYASPSTSNSLSLPL